MLLATIGGTFNLAWEVWPPARVKGEREKVTGVIKPHPIPYHLNLDTLDVSYSVSEWYQKAQGHARGLPLFRVFGLDKLLREPTSGLEPLTSYSSRAIGQALQGGCTTLQSRHL